MQPHTVVKKIVLCIENDYSPPRVKLELTADTSLRIKLKLFAIPSPFLTEKEANPYYGFQILGVSSHRLSKDVQNLTSRNLK